MPYSTPLNNVTTTLALDRPLGGTTLQVASGTGTKFGAPSPSAPVRVTVVRAAAIGSIGQILDTTQMAIYLVTGRTGDVLTIGVAQEGTTDRAFAGGDVVGVYVTAGTISELQTGKADDDAVVHLDLTETISGEKTFSSTVMAGVLVGSSSASGTLTLTATSHATTGRIFLASSTASVNLSAAGASAAQFEVKAKDGSTPIFAGYVSTGGAAPITIGAAGQLAINTPDDHLGPALHLERQETATTGHGEFFQRFQTPYAPQGIYSSYFNSAAAYYSLAWINISGRYSGSGSTFRILAPTGRPYMGGFWADVDSHTVVIRDNATSGAYHLGCINDATGKYVFGIMPDGKLSWGVADAPASGSLPAFDAHLTRPSAGVLQAIGALSVGSTATSLAQVTVYPSSAATIGVVVKGAASQSASLTEWQTSGGTLVASISTTTTYLGTSVGINASPLAQLHVSPSSSGTKGILVQGGLGQTANLTEWQSSGSAVLASVLPTGTISSTTEFRLSNTFSRVAIADGGGGFAGGYNVKLTGSVPQHDSTGSASGYHYHSDGTVRLFTASSAASGTNIPERLRITTGGLVGIGTTTPDILGAGANYRTVTVLGPASGASEGGAVLELASQQNDGELALTGLIDFMANSVTASAGAKRIAYIAGYTEGTTALNRGGTLRFATKPDAGTVTERMRITSAGRVGIGSTNPAAVLHVVDGSANVILGNNSFGADWGVVSVDPALSTAKYALASSLATGTYINAAASREVAIRIANVSALVINATTATLTDAVNLAVGTTTGTKIGTSTSQKIGFWNAAPVVQQVFATGASHTVDELITLLQTLGLCKQS